MFFRDPFTSMKAGKNIVFNWPEKDSEDFDPFYPTNFSRMRKENLLKQNGQ